ncbi:MAG: hypothetical protein KGO82_06025 [Bacteroidota bacterium]|nr:hypothetical protein [Bacteroidota bacterium]
MNNNFKVLVTLHLIAMWGLTFSLLLVKENTMLGLLDLVLCSSLILQFALQQWRPSLFGPKK